MKRAFLVGIFVCTLSSPAAAYFIGGEYARLLSCTYGKYGYQYGNIGTYETNSGEVYRIFFGSSYCQQ